MSRGGRGELAAGIVLALYGLSGALAQGDALPNGMRIARGKGALADHLVVGPPFAAIVPLPEGGVSELESVRFDGVTQTVTIRYQTRCELASKVTLPLAVLEARVENGKGLVALGQRRYADAASSFERATTLDPTFPVACTNLASSRMRANDRAGALNALRSLAAESPAWLYAKVLTDSDLAPLIDAAPIAALRAPQAGSAKLSEKDLPRVRGYIAAAPGLIAVGNAESDWGADCGSSYQLLVFNVKDGKQLTAMSLGGVVAGESPCKPTRGRATEVAAANRFLADLGFTLPADGEVGAVSFDEGRQVGKVYFPKAHLGLVEGERALRLLTGDRELTRYGVDLGKLSFAQLLPSSHVIVVGWERPAREGCESVDPRGVVVLPLPAPPAP